MSETGNSEIGSEEVNAPASGDEQFSRMLEQSLTGLPATAELKAGDKVTGKVVQLQPEWVFLDFGGRSEGMIAAAEFLDEAGALGCAIGDSVEAVVSSADGEIVLTRSLKLSDASLDAIRGAQAARTPVEGTVKAVNTGGFEVYVGKVRGFCPYSQMDLHPVSDSSTWIGRTTTFRVLEVAEGGRVVLSRRSLLEEERRAKADQVRARLEVGAELDGVVTRLADFGAFVDLGGLEGMVHISELRRARVDKVTDVVSPGHRVRVRVLRMENLGASKERISLSMKAMERDPWEDLAGKFSEGETLQGTVVRLADFGAFVEVAPGIEGLVHVSQVSRRRVARPHDALQEGQQVAVVVLKVDPTARRLSLSIKQAQAAEGPAVEAGKNYDGVVVGIKPYGIFVELPSGQTGLLPRDETDLPRGSDLTKAYQEGDTLKVDVLQIAEDGKIRLSTKSAQAREESAQAQEYMRARPARAQRPDRPEQAAPAPASIGAFAEAFRVAQERQKK